MTKPKIIYDYAPNNLPPEILGAIGLALASASQTASIVNMAIGGCLGLDGEYTLALTAHMADPLKFSVLRSAAEIRLEVDALDELDIILSEVESALGKRNGLAHDIWCSHPKTGTIYRQRETSRVRLELKSVPATVNEIKAEAALIYDVGMKLMIFLVDHGLVPPIAPLRPRDHKSPAARKKRREKLGK